MRDDALRERLLSLPAHVETVWLRGDEVRTQRPGMHYGYDVANVHAHALAQQPVAVANHSCNASSWDVFAAAAAAAAAAGWN